MGTNILQRLAQSSDDTEAAHIANDILLEVHRSTLSIESVASQLQCESPLVKKWVAWVLKESSRRCGSSVAKYLLGGMRDADSDVRSCCAECLGRLHGEWFVPSIAALIFHLGDDFFVSVAAFDVLIRRIKGEEAEVSEKSLAIAGYLTREYGLPQPDAEAAVLVLTHATTDMAASQGVHDDAQRIALLWAIKAAVLEPPMLAALSSGVSSKHDPVAAICMEKIAIEIRKCCERALQSVNARQSRVGRLALSNLAEAIARIGGAVILSLKTGGEFTVPPPQSKREAAEKGTS